VFALSAPKQKGGVWKEKILHRFTGVVAGGELGDGANPNGGLILDSKGAVYGSTYFGGSVKGVCKAGSGGTGCGTVFELIPTNKGEGWSEKILRRFDGTDGGEPAAGIVFGQGGNLFGTTVYGGDNGWGVVFELRPPSGQSSGWTEVILYRFAHGNDGANPMAGLTLNSRGDLYGAAYRGAGGSLYGDVFRLGPPSGQAGTLKLSVLYGFSNLPNGAASAANVIFDKAGNLYGTTQYGGIGTECGQGNCGTVFEISP
jgi:uncharacterized repeat protein (TIGR03803 family)